MTETLTPTRDRRHRRRAARRGRPAPRRPAAYRLARRLRLGSRPRGTPKKTLARAPEREAARDAGTVIAAYIPFALALGAALASTNVHPVVAWSSSFLVFAGAAQLVAVQLLASGTGVAVVVLTALVVNSRHLLYSASLAPHTQSWSRRTRGFSAYFLADPVYALAIGRFETRVDESGEPHRRYYLTMAITLWAAWVSLTGLGGLLAGLLPTQLPLELAAPLTFLVLLLPTLKSRATYVAGGAAGAVAVLATGMPLGLGMLLAAAVGVVAGAITEGNDHA